MNVMPCPRAANHGRTAHPSMTCYRDHGCKCDGCRVVHRRYMANYRARRERNGGMPLRPKRGETPQRTSASGAIVVNGSDIQPNAAKDKPGPAPVPRLTDAQVAELRQRLGVRPEHIGPYAEPTTRGKRDRRYYPEEKP